MINSIIFINDYSIKRLKLESTPQISSTIMSLNSITKLFYAGDENNPRQYAPMYELDWICIRSVLRQ